jgi:pyruvate/2-oxoglutarate dehydrogenase complex dihydrolipoamide dehydrogenase (E3) component
LPEATRIYRARTALGPAGACWLPNRVLGQFPILLSQTLIWAKTDGDSVRLGVEGPDNSQRELTADHVIAGTGYRSDLARLTFLSAALQQKLKRVADTAAVNGSYESSVPGLYFIGPAVAPTFGPVMRFVYGSDHAARTVARQLTRTSRRSSAKATVGAQRSGAKAV